MSNFYKKWHASSPSMSIEGTLSASRNGSTVSGSVSAVNKLMYSDGHFESGYIVLQVVSSTAGVVGSQRIDAPLPRYPGSSPFNFNFSFDNDKEQTLSVHMLCYFKNTGCTVGYGDVNVGGDVYIPLYDPEVPPTNVSTGVVHTTSNTSNANQSPISAKPDEEIWFDWWGQSNGYPEKNEISHYNVDINTTNNPDSASSIGITDHYIQNTHLSLFTICKSFNVKVGGTLYFWVNAYTKGGAWLGKVYLGSVKIKKDGAIFIKDGSNKREVVAAYIKDSNGNRVKLSNIQIKDGSNKRKIDVYTTLYE